jgi:hypothetical protein
MEQSAGDKEKHASRSRIHNYRSAQLGDSSEKPRKYQLVRNVHFEAEDVGKEPFMDDLM